MASRVQIGSIAGGGRSGATTASDRQRNTNQSLDEKVKEVRQKDKATARADKKQAEEGWDGSPVKDLRLKLTRPFRDHAQFIQGSRIAKGPGQTARVFVDLLFPPATVGAILCHHRGRIKAERKEEGKNRLSWLTVTNQYKFLAMKFKIWAEYDGESHVLRQTNGRREKTGWFPTLFPAWKADALSHDKYTFIKNNGLLIAPIVKTHVSASLAANIVLGGECALDEKKLPIAIPAGSTQYIKGKAVLWTTQATVKVKNVPGLYVWALYPYTESGRTRASVWENVLSPFLDANGRPVRGLESCLITADSHYYSKDAMAWCHEHKIYYLVAVGEKNKIGPARKLRSNVIEAFDRAYLKNTKNGSFMTVYVHRADKARKKLSINASNAFTETNEKEIKAEKEQRPLSTGLYERTFGGCDVFNYDMYMANMPSKEPGRGGEAAAWDGIWFRILLGNLRTLMTWITGKEPAFAAMMATLADELWDLAGTLELPGDMDIDGQCDCEWCQQSLRDSKAAGEALAGHTVESRGGRVGPAAVAGRDLASLRAREVELVAELESTRDEIRVLQASQRKGKKVKEKKSRPAKKRAREEPEEERVVKATVTRERALAAPGTIESGLERWFPDRKARRSKPADRYE
jgi:hypothetical protein